jgi:predicted nucleic acid-binding protein
VSGVKFLLDTNVVIGLLKNTDLANALLATKGCTPAACAVSQITRIELFSYPNLSVQEDKTIRAFLKVAEVILLNNDIEQATIAIRKNKKLKLPDAVVAATAVVKSLQLLTFDKALLKAFDIDSKA